MTTNAVPDQLERTNVFSTRSILGTDITNSDGEDLGSIEELMLNAEHGTIAYAVVKFGGGLLGKGEKLFAIPWEAFSLSLHDKKAILQVPRKRLADAEGFDEDDWPEVADASWARDVHEYYDDESDSQGTRGRSVQP